MNSFDKLVQLLSKKNLTCQLNHGRYVPKDTKAVDYLTIDLEYTKSKLFGDTKHTINIPVCQHCKETLESDTKTWVLFVCVNCGASQWKIRKLLKTELDDSTVQLFYSCPKCRKGKDGHL